MSTPAQLAAEMEALLAYETASNDEFYECNSDPEAAEGAAAQEDAPEALDDAQPSEEAAEAQEQGPVIPFALPPSDTMFHSLEEAWEFLDGWTGPRGYGLRIHRQGRPNLSGEINSIYLVCDRADPRNKKRSAVQRSRDGSLWRLISTHFEHSHEPSWGPLIYPSLRRRGHQGEISQLIKEQLHEGLGAQLTTS
ncbi:hypothetical protein PV08_05409 [Exophiala spinifera]|uniref:FAR1 domain-containing protein n=1 Tax=Exophiala spinifera TaxID=91928 RepID=A0A0D2B8W6_9EURO|nr:uncharacterized protein PV08_05409 [Exophiala spinifera]KIW15363.1 hypothetical protein PV08_05409 [Exophiala spinifera]